MKYRDEAVGDLEEIYHLECEKPGIGPERAATRFRSQVFWLWVNLLWVGLRREIGILLLTGLLRRWMS